MDLRVAATTDASEAMAACGAHLEADPVSSNLALTILRERITRPTGGRYWWVTQAGAVAGFAWHTPATYKVGVTRTQAACARALADAVFRDSPSCPGVIAEAGTAATFAGHWTEIAGTGAVPEEGQRIYCLDEVRSVSMSPGALRVATSDDVDLLTGWTHQFHREVGMHVPTDEVAALVRRRTESGWLWVWDDGEPVTTAMLTPPMAGVARIGFVFTPPARRLAGYAGSAVAALSAHALDRGASSCTLHTQLSNGTSNAIYRRIGYRSVAEVLTYSFLP